MKQESLQSELNTLLHNVKEEPQKALLAAEKALLIAQRNGWVRIMALANLLLGWANLEEQIYEPAVENFQRANTLFKDTQESDYASDCCFGLGSVYVRIGEYTLAIEQFRMALSLVAAAEDRNVRAVPIRINLSRGLMNLNYWSDAEQELSVISDMTEFNDVLLAEYQLLLLRLAFFRGNQREVRDQLRLCRELVFSLDNRFLRNQIEYFSSRYVLKYENVKQGEAQLSKLWEKIERNHKDVYFLTYEAALELLTSDYPQRGVYWLRLLLDNFSLPLTLAHSIHNSLANFYSAHLSHELAIRHYQEANRVSLEMRESEVSLQWARFRAEEMHHNLRHQVDQHKKSNQILAESNALLQAVNRIALAVNAALDQESMLRRLREQLSGWIEADIVAIAELKDEQLFFDCVLEGDQRLPPDSVSLSEEHAWSVRAVKESRILIENEYAVKESPLADMSNPVRSVSFIPLKCENRVIGVLSLQSRTADVFGSRAISLLEYIAPVIGIAFANLVNLERTRELSGALNKQQQELDDVRQFMAHIAEHDELTGLPNRASLPEHFEHWQARAPFHCLLLRIVNLDELNSAAGYGVDEEIIRVIAQRINNRIRPDDLLARVGTDQFLLFVECMRPNGCIKEFSDQIIQLAVQPLRSKDTTVCAEAAMGIVKYPDHGETLDEIMSMGTIAVNYAVDDESPYYCIE